MLHLFDALLAVNFFEQARVAIKIDEWRGLRVIDVEPILNRLRFVVVALSQLRAVFVAFAGNLGRIGKQIIHRSASWANPARRQSINQQLVAHLDVQHRADFLFLFRQRGFERVGLRDRARKAIERHAFGAIGACDAFHHHLDGHIVRHQLTLVHKRLGEHAEWRLFGNVLAEEIAARNVREPELLPQEIGLRAFARPRRSEQNQVLGNHPHLHSEMLLDKALVMAHQQLRLQLFHGIQDHTDDDQQAGACNQQGCRFVRITNEKR